MQGAEDKVARERRLNGHLGGSQVAYFTHHDDVRVLPHQRAQAFGKTHVEHGLHLGLVEGRHDHLDGVFNRANVDFLSGQLFERGVKRGGLATARGAGDQDDAVGPRDELRPALCVMRTKAQGFDAFDGGLGVKDAHHHLFAKGCGQGAQAHFHFAARCIHCVGALGLDAAIERPALFDHVHAAQELDARGHGVHHTQGDLVDGVQNAVDAKADGAHVTARLQVDVAGALIERVLPQPIHHLHNTLVIGVQLTAGFAEFNNLLKARRARDFTRLGGCTHGTRQGIELGREAPHIVGVGHHQAHAASHVAFDFGHPGHIQGLGRGNHDFFGRQGERQGAAHLGVLHAHHFGHAAHIGTQRVDALITQATAQGQPLGEPFHIK